MSQKVQVEGVGTVEFPDDATPDEISKALNQSYPANKVGAGKAFLEHAATGVAPSAAFMAAFGPGAEVGAGVGSVGGPVGVAIGSGIGGLITGGLGAWGASKLQHRLLQGAAPEFTKRLDEELAAGAQQHPVASIAGELTSMTPSAKLAPLKLATLPFRAALGAGVGAVQPIVTQRRLPTGGELATGAIAGTLFGEPRFSLGKTGAYAAGRIAASEGKTPADNPHEATSARGELWLTGLNDAKDALKKGAPLPGEIPKQPGKIKELTKTMQPGLSTILEAIAQKVANPDPNVKLTPDESKMLSGIGEPLRKVFTTRVAELRKGGDQNASKEQTPAEVHGNVPAQPTPRTGEVPKPGGVGGIRTQAEGGVPEEEKHLTPWHAVVNAAPGEFQNQIKQSGFGNVTQWAYHLANQIKASDIPRLEEIKKASDAKFAELMPKQGEKMSDELLQKRFGDSTRGQLFTEAIRMRQAIDEAKSTGATTDEQLDTIAKKHGVGSGVGGEMGNVRVLRDAIAREPKEVTPNEEEKGKKEEGVLTPPVAGEVTTPRHTFLTSKWGAAEPSSAKEMGWVLGTEQLKEEGIDPKSADKVIQDALDAGVAENKIDKIISRVSARTKNPARGMLQRIRNLIPRAPGGKIVKSESWGPWPDWFTEDLRKRTVFSDENLDKSKKGIMPWHPTDAIQHAFNSGKTPTQILDILDESKSARGAIQRLTRVSGESTAPSNEITPSEPPPPEPPTPGSLPTAPPEPPGPGTGEGPGAAPFGFTTGPAIKALTDSVQTLADANPKKPQLRKAFTLGERWDQLRTGYQRALIGLRAAGIASVDTLRGKPIITSWKQALGRHDVAMTDSVLNQWAYRYNAVKAFPDPVRRGAISAWLGVDGDDAQLDLMEQQAPAKYKKYFTAARNLTPDEKVAALNHQLYFEGRLEDAQDAGILVNGVENYLHRIYPDADDFNNKIINELGSGIYTGRPGLAKQRVYRTDLDAMLAGLDPEMDFSLRTAAYDHALNKAIADRALVKDLMQIRMPDGRPMIDVGGIGQKVEGPEGDVEALLVKPQWKRRNADDPLNNRGDYQSRNYAPLRKWRWVDTDENGKDTMVQGDVLVHPDAIRQVEKLFESSKIRKWKPLGVPVGRALLGISNTVKQTALDLSLFHPVQLTVHGLEHRVFEPYNNWTAKALGMEVTPIDMENPIVRSLVEHGLQLVDHNNSELFSEGLSGSSLSRHIPFGVGEKIQAMNDWLFHDWIPRLKLKMAMHALERNRENFPELSEPELHELTANQANAAFGELNWRRMGVSRTTQDVLRLSLLAPDFLIARGKYSAQALQAGIPRRLPGGGFGSGFGREQATAMLLFGALSNYILARILNKWDNGNYHFELENAFSIVHKSKAYSLRTAHGDMLHLITDFPGFWYNRLNPTFARTGIEFLTRRDQFGRKRTTMEQFQDLATMMVPISGRGLLHPREQSLLESFSNAMGITEHRSTSIDNIYRLAENFKRLNNIAEPAERIYNADRDPYRGIKLASLYRSPNEVADELDRAFKARVTDKEKLYNHFKEYARRPFSGSKAREKQFYDSLSEDEKGLYKEAWGERQKMIDNLSKGWAIYVQRRANKP